MTRRFYVHTADGRRTCKLCGERIPKGSRFVGVYRGPPSPPKRVARVCELCIQTLYAIAMHEQPVPEIPQ
jgi:hypothetical protein